MRISLAPRKSEVVQYDSRAAIIPVIVPPEGSDLCFAVGEALCEGLYRLFVEGATSLVAGRRVVVEASRKDH